MAYCELRQVVWILKIGGRCGGCPPASGVGAYRAAIAPQGAWPPHIKYIFFLSQCDIEYHHECETKGKSQRDEIGMFTF